MRRRIVILSVIFVPLLLVAGIGYFGLGWWQPSQATIIETAAGTPGKPATLRRGSLPEAMVTAQSGAGQIERKVRDYSAVIVKKERIGKQLVETEMFAKIREKPLQRLSPVPRAR